MRTLVFTLVIAFGFVGCTKSDENKMEPPAMMQQTDTMKQDTTKQDNMKKDNTMMKKDDTKK